MPTIRQQRDVFAPWCALVAASVQEAPWSCGVDTRPDRSFIRVAKWRRNGGGALADSLGNTRGSKQSTDSQGAGRSTSKCESARRGPRSRLQYGAPSPRRTHRQRRRDEHRRRVWNGVPPQRSGPNTLGDRRNDPRTNRDMRTQPATHEHRHNSKRTRD